MNSLVLLLSLLSLGSPLAQASWQKLLGEFEKENLNLRLANYQIELSEIEAKQADLLYRTSLTGGVSRVDRNLEILNVFAPTRTITNTTTLGVARPLIWGGNFTVQNEWINYDLSNWEARFRGARGETVSDNQIAIGYSQNLGRDLFGRISRANLYAAHLNFEVTKLEQLNQSEQQYFEFFKNWIMGRLAKTLQASQKKALSRAQRRLSLINKRVKDGLNLKVDLWQARIEYNTQNENYLGQTEKLKSTLLDLSRNIHRTVDDDEISPYSVEVADFAIPAIDTTKNRNLLAIQGRQKLLNEREKVANLSIGPEIIFSGEYRSNAIEGTFGSAFSDSLPGSDNHQKTIALSVSMPFDFTSEELELSKNRTQKLINSAQLRTTELNLQATRLRLGQRMELLVKNLESTKKKRKYALNALYELNRLFGLGKVDLDRVIRAEEQLLQTERSFFQFYSDFLVLKAQAKLISGSLIKFLKSYEV